MIDNLTLPCDGMCGDPSLHTAHLNADWNGRTWVGRSKWRNAVVRVRGWVRR